MINRYLIIILVLFLFGCREEILLSFQTNEKTVVVEGGITNKPGPYSVKLSTSLPVNQPLRIPLENCTVTILDDGGYSEVLTESKPGIYTTDASGIQGQIGKSYAITIRTPEGESYSTAFQEMKASVEIDSVYAELTSREDLDYPFGLPGMQFSVSTKIASDEAYFLWNLTETFKYNADYKLYGIYNFGDYYYTNLHMDTIASITGIDYDTVFTCYNTKTVKSIFTGKTNNLSVPKINKQPLHFVSTENKKLSLRYGLLVEQFTISEEAYYFWNSIQEQTTDENFLNTKQPYNVAGNLKNVENETELTFGFFTVASVTTKRIFVDRPNTTFYFERGYLAEPLELYKKKQPVFLVLTDDGLFFTHPDCVDCRTEGGEITEPDFWVDN